MTREEIENLPDNEYEEFLQEWGMWLDENPDAYTFKDGKLVVLDSEMPEEAMIVAEMLYEGSQEFEQILRTRSMLGLD